MALSFDSRKSLFWTIKVTISTPWMIPIVMSFFYNLRRVQQSQAFVSTRQNSLYAQHKIWWAPTLLNSPQIYLSCITTYVCFGIDVGASVYQLFSDLGIPWSWSKMQRSSTLLSVKKFFFKFIYKQTPGRNMTVLINSVLLAIENRALHIICRINSFYQNNLWM